MASVPPASVNTPRIWLEAPAPESVVLVTESRRLPEWQNLFAAPDLAPAARSGTQVILKNHP